MEALEERAMLPSPNFATSFTVTRTPREAFDAIRNVRAWWSEEIQGSTERVGERTRVAIAEEAI
jgi:hypothetical protein